MAVTRRDANKETRATKEIKAKETNEKGRPETREDEREGEQAKGKGANARRHFEWAGPNRQVPKRDPWRETRALVVLLEALLLGEVQGQQ